LIHKVYPSVIPYNAIRILVFLPSGFASDIPILLAQQEQQQKMWQDNLRRQQMHREIYCSWQHLRAGTPGHRIDPSWWLGALWFGRWWV